MKDKKKIEGRGEEHKMLVRVADVMGKDRNEVRMK